MVSVEIRFFKDKKYDSGRSSERESRRGGGGGGGETWAKRNSNSTVSNGMEGFEDTLVT